MLDPRIYRAAFLPILFVLVLVGFSLRDQPRGVPSTLAPDAFDETAAFAQLQRLAREAPDRTPGSAGDRLVAQRVEQTFRLNDFNVEVRRHTAQTAGGEQELTTVIGERTGFSSRRILVVAQRDATGTGAEAQLSGTAALMELSRVLGGRTLDRTLVLASISGGRDTAQALADAPGGPVDGVLLLGDLAGEGLVRPLVVPWSDDARVAPLELRRTVESALLRETGLHAGGISPFVQFARLSFPLTISDQGPFNAAGIPAVLLSASGERPPAADQPVTEERLGGFGRAALRSMSALDRGPDMPAPSTYILIERKLLPEWPIRVLGIALILPVLLAGIDGFARVRRRGQRVGRWFGWLAATALPFVLAVLTALALGATGLLEVTPSGAVPIETVPRDGTALAALAGVLVVLAIGWFGVRRVVLRYLVGRADPASPGAAAAVVLVLCALTIAIWVANPYTALLLVPALHLWLLMVVPEVRLHPLLRLALFALGLVPALLVAFVYARQFALDPLELAWSGLLLVAGGGVGIVSALVWAVVLGCATAVLAIILRTAGGGPDSEAPITVRGPSTYAGPGSLGGTQSALRR